MVYYLLTFALGLTIAAKIRRPYLGFALSYAIGACGSILSTLVARDIALGANYQIIAMAVVLAILWGVCFRDIPRIPSRVRGVWRDHKIFIVYIAAYLSLLGLWLGAYVEIPADPLGVHLFRVADWLRLKFIPFGAPYNTVKDSSLYLGYTFMSQAFAASSFSRATTIEVVSVFNSLLLSGAIYQCAHLIMKSSLRATLATVLAHLTMGIGVYSYFRYYAFAPGMLNMSLVVGFYSVLWVAKDRLLQSRSVWLFGALASAICFFTHKQEALFLFILAGASLFYWSWPATSPRFYQGNRWATGALIACGLAALFSLAAAGRLRQEGILGSLEFKVVAQTKEVLWFAANPFVNSRTTQVFNLAIVTLFVFMGLNAIRHVRASGLRSFWGDPWTFLFFLACVPLILVFCPLFATPLSFFFYDAVFYRLLYGSFFFIPATVSIFSLASTGSQWIRALLFFAVISLAIGPNRRVNHFFYRGDPWDSYRGRMGLYEKIGQLPTVKNLPGACTENCPIPEIYTDPVTSHALYILTGKLSTTCYYWRCYQVPTFWTVAASEEELWQLIEKQEFAVINLNDGFTKSRFALHWPEDVRDTRKYYDKRILEWFDSLEKKGWVEKLDVFEGAHFYRIKSSVNGEASR